MDKLNFYREVIQKILGDYSERRSDENIESQAIFDLKRDHYQVVNVGWENGKRVYGCVLHLDIKNDKIWLQYNGTEIDIGQELVELGVPKTEIVLGFQAPHRRQYTDYAVS
ncbi:MAG: XisI protein [Cyanobacteria bacterium RI_101]|nr:XisI protein [Cyanobacteria bacterium RI_101]